MQGWGFGINTLTLQCWLQCQFVLWLSTLGTVLFRPPVINIIRKVFTSSPHMLAHDVWLFISSQRSPDSTNLIISFTHCEYCVLHCDPALLFVCSDYQYYSNYQTYLLIVIAPRHCEGFLACIVIASYLIQMVWLAVPEGSQSLLKDDSLKERQNIVSNAASIVSVCPGSFLGAKVIFI